MNKTLKDNELDIKFLEGTIRNWEDYDETKESEEFKTINEIFSKKDYENWKCIYTSIVINNEDLKEDYDMQLNTIKDYDSEIRMEEYFDNAITLYVKTKGLFICEAVEEDQIGNDIKFRVTLYKYNNSDHKIVGKR